MSENQKEPQYKLRWTEDLRDKVMNSAKENNRSINQEIIVRLEESFLTKDKEPDNKLIYETLEQNNERLERAMQVIDRLMDKIIEIETNKPTN
ncbi:Arc family DNA-binding protein [Acinetobacter venetianus]|uniref:Arc-like DNA binding domain protein n=1 Tax=Acinetobacter venetianus TaxID=52133 RepID=A0A150HY63_9GAMM|nr:Arc family DNA-binding protein [Acinetobacter venetianus]KXZ72133.1 Arc-like DNA binding domain protein [Acinetobacter venetianus]